VSSSTDRVARRAAVLGHPIGHSLSPRLHRAAYAALGLDDWRYDSFDLVEADLPAFMERIDETWAGLSLTMPLKQVVIPLVDHVEPLAAVVGAVNTVIVQPGGRRPVLTGANTDVHGIVAALGEAGATPVAPGTTDDDRHAGHAHAATPASTAGRTAAVIGAGATAASALAALAELGCPTPVVYVRSLGRVGPLARAAHRMGVEPVYRSLDEAAAGIVTADLVVSTLPPGAADELAPALLAGPPVDGAALLDVAYDPRRSPLMAAWEQRGGRAVCGERMLLHQAVEQVRLMTGRPGPLAAMDASLDPVPAPDDAPADAVTP
jgi:shikimate dehydrogenase